MSTAKRLISGTVASWMRIGVTMIAQIVLVPVYLTYWSVEEYGIWLATQAFLALLITVDHGHQTYLEFEFLRIQPSDTRQMSRVLWSGVVMGVIIGSVEIGLAVFLATSGWFGDLMGGAGEGLTPAMITEAGYVLIVLAVSNLLTTSAGGIYSRSLSPYGYFARMSWWGVLAAVLTTFSPVVAVLYGADFFTAGIVYALAQIVYNGPLLIDIFNLFRKEKISYQGFSWRLGYTNFLSSLILSLKEFLENLRQQGIRVVLIPITGPAGLTAFSTMRTGANIALQGLNTITNPLMPELMRFLNDKDQAKMEASFATVWLVVILLLAPGMIILQTFVEPLFIIWTKGRVPFNQALFASLSLSVLIYALSQPAIAVVRGNNLLRPQLYISIVASFLVVGGIYLLVHLIGILGAGLALLISEIASCFLYVMVARLWLSKQQLRWPSKQFGLAGASIVITTLSLAAMIIFANISLIIAGVGILLLAWNAVLYYLNLPRVIRDRVNAVAKRFKLTRFLVK